MSGGSSHTDVAAYILGVLDEADSAVFEAHLIDCPHCQLDLLELQDLPGVLDKVRQTWPAPPVPLPRSPAGLAMPEQPADPPHERRRIARLVVAAAVLLVVGGPLVTLAVLASASPGTPIAGPIQPPSVTQAPSTTPPPSTEPQLPPATMTPDPGTAPQSSERTNPPTRGGQGTDSPPGRSGSPNLLSQDGLAGVEAKVSVKDKTWGSKIDLELTGVTGPLTCQLLAVTDDGSAWVVAGWSVPGRGASVTRSPNPLHITGGTSLDAGDIAHFEVRALDGTLLTTVSH